ncbi:MAG: hypothetical protein ACJ73N_16610 [Bryobacteraceae bacterium]
MDPFNQFLTWVLQAITTAINPVAVISLLIAFMTFFVSGIRAASKIAGGTVVIWSMLHYQTILSFLGSH